MKTLSLFKASVTAAVFTALSFSTALMAQDKMKMMDHSKMKMADMPKAASVQKGDLLLSGAWARQSFGKAANSAGFMTIKNRGSSDDLLIGVSSTISKKTELHTHIKDGDVMRMRRVEGGIKVPKNGSTELKPGSLHVMFIGLKEPLKAGASFPLTLTFKNAGDVTLTMTAQKKAMPAKMDHGTMPRGSN